VVDVVGCDPVSGEKVSWARRVVELVDKADPWLNAHARALPSGPRQPSPVRLSTSMLVVRGEALTLYVNIQVPCGACEVRF
jgi:hypothetical protein